MSQSKCGWNRESFSKIGKKTKWETYHFYQVTMKWLVWLGELGSLYNFPTPIPQPPSPPKKKTQTTYVLFSEGKRNCKETYKPWTKQKMYWMPSHPTGSYTLNVAVWSTPGCPSAKPTCNSSCFKVASSHYPHQTSDMRALSLGMQSASLTTLTGFRKIRRSTCNSLFWKAYPSHLHAFISSQTLFYTPEEHPSPSSK